MKKISNIYVYFLIFILLLSIIRTIIPIHYHIFTSGGDFKEQITYLTNWLTGKANSIFWSDYTLMYPYFFYIIMIPFSVIRIFLGMYYAQTLAIIIGYLLYTLSILIFIKAFRKNINTIDLLIVFIISFNFNPTVEILSQAKIESWELFLISLSFYFLKNNRKYVSGYLISIAANIKYFPGILFLYYFIKKDITNIISIIITSTIIMLLVITIFGIDNTLDFYTVMIEKSYSGRNAPQYNYDNPSLTGAIMRLFVTDKKNYTNAVYENIYIALRSALILKVLILIFLVRLIYKCRNYENINLTFAIQNLLLISIFLISPVTRSLYAIFLVPAYIFAYYYYKNNYKNNLTKIIIITISYIIIGLTIPIPIIKFIIEIVWHLNVNLLNLYYFYSIPIIGYLLLFFSYINIINQIRKISE